MECEARLRNTNSIGDPHRLSAISYRLSAIIPQQLSFRSPSLPQIRHRPRSPVPHQEEAERRVLTRPMGDSVVRRGGVSFWRYALRRERYDAVQMDRSPS